MSTKNSQNLQLGKAALFFVPALVPQILYAQTEPRAVIDLSVGGAGDSNPFLESNGETAGSITLQVDPKVYWEDESSSVVFDGGLRLSQYTNRYGSDVGLRFGAQGSKKLDERTSLSVGAGFQSSRSTLQDTFFGNIGAPLNPGAFPEVPLTDVTIAGRRIRVKTLDAFVGIEHALSAADTIGITAATSYSKFGGAVGADYRTGSVGLQYGRRLSERTKVTASVDAGAADYIGTGNGDATFISPQIGIENKLSERLRWTANLGISYASVDDQFGVTRNKVYLAGDFSLCDTGVRTTFCGSGSRSAAPTALGGISAITNVAFSLEQKLSIKDSFSLSGRYGRTDQSSNPALAAIRRDNQIFGVSATYSRAVSERLSFFATPSATKIFEKQLRREANYSISVGVKMRFGKLR